MEVNSQRPVLKRTDTQAISQISPITNKFDQPQENAKQIKWDSDEEDTKKMPPPPPPSPVMPSVSPPPPPPNEKSFIKNLKKRNNESKEPLKTEPSLKFLKRSENIGKCPHQIILLLFDIEKNYPFSVVMSITNYSYHLYHLINWSQNKNIEFKSNNVVLYCYQFIEENYNHEICIINKEISEKALEACKEKKFNPFNNEKLENPFVNHPEIMEIYGNITRDKRYGVLFLSKGEKFIITNTLIYNIIDTIIKHKKEVNEKITSELIGEIIDFKSSTYFQKMFMEIMEGSFNL